MLYNQILCNFVYLLKSETDNDPYVINLQTIDKQVEFPNNPKTFILSV